MHLRRLDLEEFRCYRHLHLDLQREGLRITGANGSGKSSLLEAMMLLATTRSPRTSSDREVINWQSGVDLGFPPFARVGGRVDRIAGEVELEIALQAEGAAAGAARKQIRLNGRPVRAMDAVGALKAVMFSPEDVALIAGAPSGRRRYLDLTLSQLDGRYLRALSRYNRVLTQRNSLLKTLARDRVSPASGTAVTQLAYWDDELIAAGSLLIARRHEVVGRLAALARRRFQWLTGGMALDVTYLPSLPLDQLDRPDQGWSAEASQAVIARELTQRLEAVRPDEMRRGVSLVGPHRDDVGFAANGVDLARYGSRGQQRLAVVALKLAETDLMTEEAGEPPVLLLDDALSELDTRHQSLLTGAAVAAGSQVFITASDRALLERPDLGALPPARVEAGTIVATN